MRTFRFILVAIIWILTIISLFYVDYGNLLSRPNLSTGLNILLAILLTISLLLSNRHEKKHTEK